jgi:hypothetical protein
MSVPFIRSASLVVCLFSAMLLTAPYPTAADTPLYFGWSANEPLVMDCDGDGNSELAVFDPIQGALSVRQLDGTELAFDLPIAQEGFIAACADYDGDGWSDLGSYDHDTGVWYAFCSRTGYQLDFIQCAPGNATTAPHPADYDGDRFADPALYDASSGLWVIYPSASGYQPVSGIFGGNSMTAVPMDYDNDGKTDPAVYDENSGQWWVLCSASQYALAMLPLGGPGCVAAPGDFDGDGKADPTVYYAPLGVWGTLNSANNYELSVREQGGPGCIPVPGNYYFTNRADFAVYDTDAGTWQIAYDQLEASVASTAVPIIFSLLHTTLDWTLYKTKQYNDTHIQQILTELTQANQKLDTLLTGQLVILNQLNELSRQLQYESAKTRLLIEGGAAKDAVNTIKTYFDQGGIDGYQAFFRCDTNNLPSNTQVLRFADTVLNKRIKESVTAIHDAILPDEISQGVLRLWGALADYTLTPDNLYDHFAALRNYFLYMYSYQMKGACLYVDAARTADTSAWARAATCAYITNDVMTMLQAEVDELRAVTYNMVLTAINSAYNPGSEDNAMLVNNANVIRVLAEQEFFAKQWLGQPQTFIVTALTTDRPEMLQKYRPYIMRVYHAQTGWLPQAGLLYTNYATGRPYGFPNPDTRNIGVGNRYAFLRFDFGQLSQRSTDYKMSGDGNWEVNFNMRNYDDDMQPTTAAAYSNWFAHVYASPYNYEQITLPLNDAAWAANGHSNPNYVPSWRPSGVTYDFWNQSRIGGNLDITAEITYKLNTANPLPAAIQLWPWRLAYGYPVAVSNQTGRAVKLRAIITSAGDYASVQRWDSSNADRHHEYMKNSQYWDYAGRGWAHISPSGSEARWDIFPHRRERFPAGKTSRTWYEARASGKVMTSSRELTGELNSVVIYSGAELYLGQGCFKHSKQAQNRNVPATCHIWGTVKYNLEKISLAIY